MLLIIWLRSSERSKLASAASPPYSAMSAEEMTCSHNSAFKEAECHVNAPLNQQ
jgi:hypothetical protein